MLQIMNVSAEDQGNYTCVANTSLDQAQETAELIVLGKVLNTSSIWY